MARLLLLVFLVLAVLTVAVMLLGTLGRMADRAGQAGQSALARVDGGRNMQKIAFAALILLLVGLTSGLIGGL